LHAHAEAQDVELVESVVIGLPQSMDDCRKLHDDASKEGLEKMLAPAFEVKPIQFKGFSRPIFAKLVVNSTNRRAVIVDIPTTLAVVPEFAKFVAETGGPDASGDEGVMEARKEIASLESIAKFKPAIDEFQRAVYMAALPEPLRASPISMLNFVATPRLLQRIGELTR
jgi:hypothetical protein